MTVADTSSKHASTLFLMNEIIIHCVCEMANSHDSCYGNKYCYNSSVCKGIAY